MSKLDKLIWYSSRGIAAEIGIVCLRVLLLASEECLRKTRGLCWLSADQATLGAARCSFSFCKCHDLCRFISLTLMLQIGQNGESSFSKMIVE